MIRTKGLLPVFVALLVIGLGTGVYLRSGNHVNEEAATQIDLSVVDITLKCLLRDSIETVRSSASIDVLFPQCSQELRKVLGDEFKTIGTESLRAILATVVAANFAGYGASSALSFEDIKNASHLNCGNTILLVGYLLSKIESESLKSIGFEGGFIGNHAQLLFTERGESILLDPTTGLIARTNFDDLLRGVPLNEKKIRSFSIKDKAINSFRERVYLAIQHGKYKPSDFMYMHGSLAEHKNKGSSDSYFTPGGIALRTRLKIPN